MPRSRHRPHSTLIVVPMLLLVAAGAAAVTWRSPIDPIATGQAPAFDEATIERGAQLAAVADCAGCHTAPGGMPYAGGVALETPFGIIHGTNITPDPDTGIGRWSETAFERAMREGIDRAGRHLYPAFPYDHFALVNDDELHALYAYLMTRTAVPAQAKANNLKFPFNMRPLIGFWNVLFLRDGAVQPDANASADWNRGAYLVQSLGHCGACHTPRNGLGAEDRHAALAGGEVEGWYAPPLNAASPSPLPWTVDQMTTYLREGIVDGHAIAGGPMQPVVYSLAQARPEDVRAIATYIVAAMGNPTPEREARARDSVARAGLAQGVAAGSPPASAAARLAAAVPPPAAAAGDSGAAIYNGACAGCHEQGRQPSSAGALQLPVAIALHENTPKSLIRIINEGITPTVGERGRWMPPFGGALTDAQLTALVIFLRTFAPGAPPWSNVADEVRQARHS